MELFIFLVVLIEVDFWYFFFFSSRRRHTRWTGDWSSDVCSSDLDDVAQSFLLLRDDLQRFQERECLRGPLLGQQQARSRHLLAFTGQRGGHVGLLRKFLCPVGGAIQLSTGQPELHPVHDDVHVAPVRDVVRLCQSLFCMLKGRARCLQLSSCQVDSHQDRISYV